MHHINLWNHTYIAPLIDHFYQLNEDTTTYTLYTVYPYKDRRITISNQMTTNSINRTVTYGVPALETPHIVSLYLTLIDVLAYIHRQDNRPSIHEDIRPDNMIIRDNGDVLFASMGMSGAIESGWNSFSAPEFRNAKGDMERTAQCEAMADMWACGATLLYAACGAVADFYNKTVWAEGSGVDSDAVAVAVPVPAEDNGGGYVTVGTNDIDSVGWGMHECSSVLNDVLRRHWAEIPSAEMLWATVPTPIKVAIEKCLRLDPSERPSAAELRQCTDYSVFLRMASRKNHSDGNDVDMLEIKLKEALERAEAAEGALQREREAREVAEDKLRYEIERRRVAEDRAGVMELEVKRLKEKERERTEAVYGLQESSLLAPSLPTPPPPQKQSSISPPRADESTPRHHPAFFEGEQGSWMCCNRRGRTTPGCQTGDVRHHPGYYDPYSGGRFGCCQGGWNSPGCTPGEQPRPYR